MQEMLKFLIPIIVAHVLVLVVIVIVIKRLLLSDTMTAVSRIKQVEAEVRKKEEGIRQEIEEHEKEFARKKAEAEEEIERHREAAEKELAKTRDQVIADAKKEGDAILERAKKGEEKLRQEIARDMEEKAVDYGGEVFKLVFSDKIGEELNKQFTSELLDALEEVDAASITVDSDEVEFKSSHPMDPEQKKRLEKMLADKFGVDIKIEEKIEEDLLAGLVFKLGSLEIDGSLRNRYQEAAAEVKKSAKV